MKKRFSALILTIILVLSLVLTACPANNPAGNNKVDKDLFLSAFGEKIFAENTQQAYNHKGEISVTKKNEDGNTQLKTEIDFSGYDKNYIGKLTSTQGEEIMPLELMADSDSFYYRFTDFMDAFAISNLGVDDEMLVDPETPAELDALLSIGNAVSQIAERFTTALKNGSLDNLIALAPGSSEDAKVLALNITQDNFEAISGFENLQYTFSIWVNCETEKTFIQNSNGCMSFDLDGKIVETIFDFSNNSEKTELNLDITFGEHRLVTGTYKNVPEENLANADAEFTLSFISDDEIKDIVFGFNYKESQKNIGKGDIFATINFNASEEEVPLNSAKINIPFEYNASNEKECSIILSGPSFDMGVKNTFDITVSIKTIEMDNNGWDTIFEIKSNLDIYPYNVYANLSSAPIDNFQYTKPEELYTYDYDMLTEFANRYPQHYNFLTDGNDDDFLDDSAFMVENEYDFYTLAEDGTGEIVIGYTLVSDENGKATLLLDNGKELELSYDCGDANTDNEVFEITINGRAYEVINTIYDMEHSYYASTVETAQSNGYEMSLITFDYFSNTLTGTLYAYLTYEVEGDVYTITHIDGSTETRTLAYDEEYESYYFDDQLPPSERYINYVNGDINYSFEITSKICDIMVNYEVKSTEDGKAIIVDTEGNETIIEFTNPVYDENEGEYVITIDGEIYSYQKFTEYEEIEHHIFRTYSCDCIDAPLNNIYLLYSPETNSLTVYASVHFEIDGNKVTLDLPDGIVTRYLTED